MSVINKALAGGIAGAALLLSAGAALAYPAQATGSVNVRSGPGTSYAVLDALSPGEGVDINRCEGGWCYVSHNGPDGWVSANYLGQGYAQAAPPPPPVVYQRVLPPPPPVYYGYPRWQRHYYPHYYPRYYHRPGFCVGGGGGSFCVN